MDLALLVNKFNIKGRLVTIVPFGNGNINDTFLAVFRNTFSETQVVLQRVNKAVFPQPELIMRNMHNITLHCHERLEADAAAGRDDRVWQMTRIIKTKDGADFVTDEKGDVWRVITRILSAHAFDTAQSPEHALECGAALEDERMRRAPQEERGRVGRRDLARRLLAVERGAPAEVAEQVAREVAAGAGVGVVFFRGDADEVGRNVHGGASGFFRLIRHRGRSWSGFPVPSGTRAARPGGPPP